MYQPANMHHTCTFISQLAPSYRSLVVVTTRRALHSAISVNAIALLMLSPAIFVDTLASLLFICPANEQKPILLITGQARLGTLFIPDFLHLIYKIMILLFFHIRGDHFFLTLITDQSLADENSLLLTTPANNTRLHVLMLHLYITLKVLMRLLALCHKSTTLKLFS